MNRFVLFLIVITLSWRYVVKATQTAEEIYKDIQEKHREGLKYEAQGKCASLAGCETPLLTGHSCFLPVRSFSCDRW